MDNSTSNDSGYSSPKSSSDTLNKTLHICGNSKSEDIEFSEKEKGKSKNDNETNKCYVSESTVRPNKSYKEIVAKILLNSDKGEMSLREIVDKVLK